MYIFNLKNSPLEEGGLSKNFLYEQDLVLTNHGFSFPTSGLNQEMGGKKQAAYSAQFIEFE